MSKKSEKVLLVLHYKENAIRPDLNSQAHYIIRGCPLSVTDEQSPNERSPEILVSNIG